LIREAAAGRPIVVAGSTVGGDPLDEEAIVIQAWEGAARREFDALLVIAPRHPERFGEGEAVAMEFAYALASDWATEEESVRFANTHLRRKERAEDGAPGFVPGRKDQLEIVLLDTIGDLAAVYGVADVAFVGGSLVKRGGHNPLEPAQFGVPVVMGPSYENFRDVVQKMRDAGGIAILEQTAGLSTAAAKSAASGRDDNSTAGRDDNSEVRRKAVLKDELEAEFVGLLANREAAKAMGERGRQVFEQQQGATKRAVEAIVAMVTP